ncbi:uncharacterized protein TrAtP1_006357 [Trichoderma atroviride]|uniref:uncharacterized protein n=1 Tax=Hypocrea atroviridis TaxID=63577 RepID=UPI003318922A|nr:hypothetical protein TrAtP1_006357 [Trichoderma atroviride]
MSRRAWEWWVDEGGRGIAIRSQRRDKVGVEIHDGNASCELFADRQLVKHKKSAYAYHSISLYATSCPVTHTIFQVTWTQQYRPLAPSGILHLTSTYIQYI